MTTLTFVFIFIRFLSQTYLFLPLRLPSLYFLRVSRLFEDTNLSLPDIQRMAVINGDQFSVVSWTPDAAATPPIQHVLEGFIDALPQEWKTQNFEYYIADYHTSHRTQTRPILTPATGSTYSPDTASVVQKQLLLYLGKRDDPNRVPRAPVTAVFPTQNIIFALM
ncbi:hypothetical protein DFH08DRAFT_971919 [Mycena albidolilacea]|uniref:Uncharacterized protein n=1 Tax=Mycena albidolilacea TaxID=1033008 RepID=A0AAD6ZCD9_9AGAR|nr:hypothetical protein DFH08DRAFT_971919 [Mycena albidolilacea]